MKHKLSNERGQVMVLMAIGMVVFLGFVALALDGGMAYSDRRQSQNGADASSLAGGGAAALSLENSHVFYTSFSCSDGRVIAAQNTAIAAAISRAGDNNFTIDSDNSDMNGVTTKCGQEMTNGFMDKYIDITTEISMTTDTSFIQLFMSDALINQVQAVTRVRPRMPLAYGHAVVATGSEPCNGNQNGVIIGGNSETKINGGGIWSNGCLGINGSSYGVNVTNGGVNYAGGINGDPSNITPAPNHAAAPMDPEKFTVPPPDCSDPAAHHVDGKDLEGTLQPGLYCVSGNATINGGGTLQGEGVTIYMIDGELTINGGTDVNLEAPTGANTAPAINGVLLYSAQGSIDLEGNATSFYLGLVYAPNGEIKAHGSNGTNPTFNTQLVANHVDISGNASIDINFNPELAYAKPSSLELYK